MTQQTTNETTMNRFISLSRKECGQPHAAAKRKDEEPQPTSTARLAARQFPPPINPTLIIESPTPVILANGRVRGNPDMCFSPRPNVRLADLPGVTGSLSVTKC